MAALGAAAAAQPHPGKLLLGGGYPTPGSTTYLAGFFRVDKQTGAYTTVIDTGTSPTRTYYVWDMAMDLDNQGYKLATGGTSSTLYDYRNGVFDYDPVSSTWATFAAGFTEFSSWNYAIKADQNGDWTHVARSSAGTLYGIYRHSGGSFTTVATTLTIGNPTAFSASSTIDYATGDLLLPSSGTATTSIRSPVYQVRYDGTITTWNASAFGGYPREGVKQRIANGNLYYLASGRVVEVRPGTAAATTIATVAAGAGTAYGFLFENQTAAATRAICVSRTAVTTLYNYRLHELDPDGAWAVTRTASIVPDSPTLVPTPYPFQQLHHENDRYIQTVRSGSRRWDVLFQNPFFAGKGYVAAATCSGIRPGFALLDGRRVWINVDPCVFVTVQNLVPTIWNAGPGTLDAAGRAKGWIDVGSVSPAELGVYLHLVLAILDNAAPSGIAFVTEPYALRI